MYYFQLVALAFVHTEITQVVLCFSLLKLQQLLKHSFTKAHSAKNKNLYFDAKQ